MVGNEKQTHFHITHLNKQLAHSLRHLLCGLCASAGDCFALSEFFAVSCASAGGSFTARS